MLRRFDVEVDLYGSHAIAIILRAITMPFEVFIFSGACGKRPVGHLTPRRSRAVDPLVSAHSRNRPEKPRLPNRESAIDFAHR